jgi:hypothetical protein
MIKGVMSSSTKDRRSNIVNASKSDYPAAAIDSNRAVWQRRDFLGSLSHQWRTLSTPRGVPTLLARDGRMSSHSLNKLDPLDGWLGRRYRVT